MKTILVSGASGIVGYGILRSLRNSSLPCRLIGTTIYEDSVAGEFSDVFEKALVTKDEGYTDWLVQTIRKHKVDLVIPSIEADLYKWAENKSEIEQTGAIVMLNNPELVETCKDKWDFYNELLKSGTSYAIETRLEGSFEELSSEFGLPFLLKPRKGFASRGIVKVESEEIYNQNKSLMGPILMAQPLVGNDEEEYSTSAFCDGKGGVLASMSLKRKLAREGFTEKAEVVDLPEIKKAISELSQHFKPLGPTNFQFRADANGLKLLEINPRISSATSIRTAFGYNESEMAVNFYLNNITPGQPAIREGKAIRYTEDLIIYNENRNHI